MTPSFLIYNRAFLIGEVGYAAAVAIVLAAIVFVVAAGISRLLEGRGGELIGGARGQHAARPCLHFGSALVPRGIHHRCRSS